MEAIYIANIKEKLSNGHHKPDLKESHQCSYTYNDTSTESSRKHKFDGLNPKETSHHTHELFAC